MGDNEQVRTLMMQDGIRADGLEEIFEKNRVNQDKLKQGISGIGGGLKENYAEEMDTKAVVSLLLSLAGISSYCKRTQEAIIDQFFVQDEKKKPSKQTEEKNKQKQNRIGCGFCLFFITQQKKEEISKYMIYLNKIWKKNQEKNCIFCKKTSKNRQKLQNIFYLKSMFYCANTKK